MVFMKTEKKMTQNKHAQRKDYLKDLSEKTAIFSDFLLIASQRRDPEYNLVSTSICHKYKIIN